MAEEAVDSGVSFLEMGFDSVDATAGRRNELVIAPADERCGEHSEQAVSREIPRIEPVERSARLSLSPAQQQLWLITQLDELASGACQIGVALRVRGELSEPVRVVWRDAPLRIEEVELAAGDAVGQLRERFDPRGYRLDVRRAPLQRAFIAFDRQHGRWLLWLLSHHLGVDHTTLGVILAEVQAYLLGEQGGLREPVPFGNLVAEGRR